VIDQLAADRVLTTGARLAEGPLWNPEEGCLYWTDIDAHKLHRTDLDGGDLVILEGYEVGGFALRERGGLVLALPEGFAVLEPGAQAPSFLATIAEANPMMRLNDGACDAAGRFWAGSMSRDLGLGRAHLYCLEGERVRTVLDGISLSNGLDWSVDGRRLYYVDSMIGSIDCFEFDVGTGSLGRRTSFVEIADFSRAQGNLVVADGLCVDAEDCVWVAVHGAGEVRRFSPRGDQLARVTVPMPGVTSCGFGGPRLDTLFITTAEVAATGAGAKTGAVYALTSGTQGREPNEFRA
jgi:sugar lactone lactonase YvrE